MTTPRQDFSTPDEPDEWSLAVWSSYRLPVAPSAIAEWLVSQDSLIDAIVAHGTQQPSKVALHIDDDVATYGQLVERASRLAAWMREVGAADGDRILLAGANSMNLIIGCLAAMWSGGIEVVANPTLTPPELAYLVEDCAPAVVLADEPLLVGMKSSVASVPVAVLGPGRAIAPSVSDCIAATGTGLAPPELSPAAGASIQYTSGTTGRPKGAYLTHANVGAHLRSLILAWEWEAHDVLCHSLPLAHGHGRNGVFTALLAGARAIVLPRTDPERIARTLVDSEVTVFYSVPAIWDRLLNWEGFGHDAFQTVRLFTSGSAPLAPTVSDEIDRLLGARPVERYGATETGVAVTNPLIGDRLAGTVGLPVPGAEVRVVDAAGDPITSGDVGEIVVRGPAVFSGYWRRESAEYFYPDGWFKTGDLGCFGADRGGYLAITGRSKEMIVSGGLNVYPREIELVAEAVAAVHEAVVVGVPSQRWGEEVVMAVVAAQAQVLDVDELLSTMRRQLAGYKMPKACKVVRAIPRNHMGKPLRRVVAESWGDLPDFPPSRPEMSTPGTSPDRTEAVVEDAELEAMTADAGKRALDVATQRLWAVDLPTAGAVGSSEAPDPERSASTAAGDEPRPTA